MKRERWLILLPVSCVLLGTMACMLFLPPRGPLKFDPAELPEAQVGVPYETSISISDNATPVIDFSISDGTLPGGLSWQKVEGKDVLRIYGTPQEAGNFAFKVYAWCYGTNVSGQQGDKDYTLTVR